MREEEMAFQLAKVLRIYADSLLFISTSKVHQTLFPYVLTPTLHALRISMIYQLNARKAGHGKSLTWATYLAGYLVMVGVLLHFESTSVR